jgi:hypothetical protein
MAFNWPERLGPTPGASNYRQLVMTIDALRSPTPEVYAELALDGRDGSRLAGSDWVVIQYGRDAEAIRELLREYRADLSKGGSAQNVENRLRTMRGLEARARFLEGDVEGALDGFASLALDDTKAMREGDLYERTRWRGLYAQHLEAAGLSDLAREQWQAVVDGGYGTVLAMDVVHVAKVRLARLR